MIERQTNSIEKQNEMKIRTKTELASTIYKQGFDWIGFYLTDEGKIQWDWYLGSMTTDFFLLKVSRVNGLYDLTKMECREVAAKMYEKAKAAIDSPEYASHIDIFETI